MRLNVRLQWLLLLGSYLIIALPTSANVYKHIDEHGQVHYSETADQNSEPLDLPPLNTYAQPATPTWPAGPATTTAKPVPEAVTHYQVHLLSPKAEQHFTHAQHSIPIQATLSPDLAAEDVCLLLLNNAVIAEAQAINELSLPWLPRGAHTVQLVVRAKKSPQRIKGRSELITVYQQRARSS